MPEVPLEIDCQMLKRQLDAGADLLLLDCREPDEYEFAKIDQAKLLPMGEIPERLSELDPYRQRPIVVHCHHGGRSLRVVHWLRKQGFAQAQNLSGGIDLWSQEIDPRVPRY
ncbi:MAG TPA: rhodanese-like domain-containing protein [Pirellulales bacterium]|jgi:rhodanese-related sulfurtransferase